jgi:hypothetical protein
MVKQIRNKTCTASGEYKDKQSKTITLNIYLLLTHTNGRRADNHNNNNNADNNNADNNNADNNNNSNNNNNNHPNQHRS